MKLAVSLALILLGGGCLGYALDYATTRHPNIHDEGSGWTFEYILCVPTLPVGTCQKAPFDLFVPRGDIAAGLPYTKREKSVISLRDARVEAEMRADMIENVHREKE